MLILSWNIRGLGSPFKRTCVSDFMRSNRCDVVLFQETKLCQPNSSILRSFCAPFISAWSVMDSIGTAGGQMIGWNDAIFECTTQLVGTYILSVQLRHRTSANIYSLPTVYGPCDDRMRSGMFQEMIDVNHWATSCWLIAGDFNITRRMGERNVNDFFSRNMENFNDTIEGLDLYEPPLQGRAFTWSNNR